MPRKSNSAREIGANQLNPNNRLHTDTYPAEQPEQCCLLAGKGYSERPKDVASSGVKREHEACAEYAGVP